jgi:hypothetical protein
LHSVGQKRKERLSYKHWSNIQLPTSACLDWGSFIGRFCISFESELDPETFQWNTLIHTDHFSLLWLLSDGPILLYCTYSAAKLSCNSKDDCYLVLRVLNQVMPLQTSEP